jgi:hypothetical protein
VESASGRDGAALSALYAGANQIGGGNMSEHSDDKHPRQDRRSTDKQDVQGEGDYRAARRYRREVSDFVAKADVDALAREAAPTSGEEARDMALAEERGRDRSKGDDAADAGIMYPGRKP